MGKSSQRRKKDRTRHRQGAQQRHAALQRRAEVTARAESEKLMDRILDPATPVDEIAKLVLEDRDGVAPALIHLLLGAHSVDGLVAIRDAMAARQSADAPSPHYLIFAALTAAQLGRNAEAGALLDRAIGTDDRLGWVRHLRAVGRTAEVLELLADRVTDPDYVDLDLHAVHGYVLGEVHGRVQNPPAACPCGSDATWDDCCGPRERPALERFTDRSLLYRLRAAAAARAADSRFADVVDAYLTDRLEEAGDSGSPEDEDALAQLITEYAWVAAVDEADDDEVTLLDDLAADPDTPPGVAAAARAWLEHAHYGLWQLVDNAGEGPGRWCIEVTTGRPMYVAFASEQVEGLARWTVLLGAVAPIDGAWRSGAALVSMGPGEADALCELVHEAAEVVASAAAGGRRRRKRMDGPRWGQADPHTVLAGDTEPAPPDMIQFYSAVVGASIPRLYEELTYARSLPPQIQNADGEPLVLIKARIAVRDVDALLERLAMHPDVDADDGPAGLDGERVFTWQGRQIPADELEQLRAQMPDVEFDLTHVPRYALGQLRVRGRTIRVELNSQERLERLLALLAELGGSPQLVEQTRVEPTQDMAWPARPVRIGPPAPRAGDEEAWLDRPLRELRGRSPREAVTRRRERDLLEAMLRQFEYDASAGPTGPDCDLGLLRARLDMLVD